MGEAVGFCPGLWYNTSTGREQSLRGGVSAMIPQTYSDLRRCYGRAGLFLLLSTLLSEAAVELCYLPYYLGWYDLFYNDWYYYGISAMVYYPTGILAALLVLRGLPEPEVRPGPAPGPKEIFSGMAVGLGMLYAGSLFTEYLLWGTDTVDYANEAIVEEPLACTVVYVVLVAPLLEELIFRRLLLDRLLVLGDWSAVALSALLFGLFHTNLYQFFYATLVGLVLGYLRIMSGSVLWSVALHMFINFFGSVLLPSLGDSDAVYLLLSLLIYGSIGYAVYYLIRRRPWKNFYPGPTGFNAGEKAVSCLTSPALIACILLHLWLSVYYIYAA